MKDSLSETKTHNVFNNLLIATSLDSHFIVEKFWDNLVINERFYKTMLRDGSITYNV